MAEIVKANIANALNSLSGVLGTSDQIVDSETGESIKNLEEKRFYISDLTLDELVPDLSSGIIGKLSELRQHLSNKSLNLILIKGRNQTVYGTYAVATVVENESSFRFFVDDNGTTVEVYADSQNHWTCTRTTPYVKPTDGIPSTDLSSAVLTSLSKADSALQEESVFVAEYGVTTFNEISSALNDGKLPIVLNNGFLYVYSWSDSGNYYFSTGAIGRIYYAKINISNSWSTGVYVLEQTNSKKNTITGNEASNNYYPTTKAVVDYVDDKISNTVKKSNETFELFFGPSPTYNESDYTTGTIAKRINGTIADNSLNTNLNTVAIWAEDGLESRIRGANTEYGGLHLRVADNGITKSKLNTDVADDSTIELGANGLLVKNGGITNSEIANNTITSNKFNSEISAYVANMCVAQIDLIQSTDPQASPDTIILQLPDNDAVIDISTWGELKSDDKYTWFEDRQYSKFIITYGGISYIVKLEDVNSINNPTSKNEVLIFSNRDIKIAIRTSPNDGDDAELYTDGIVYNNVVWEYDNQVTPIRAKNKNIDSITNEDWQLTDLPLSQYKRLKFYITSGESSNNINPSMILEMSLDDDMACVRGTDNIKYYNCTGVGLALNNDNRLYAAVIYVDRTKSKVCFGRLQSIYGTASTNADAANRFLYKIEGYYN